MQLGFSQDDLAFAQEVRTFINENMTPELHRGQALNPSIAAEPDIGAQWLGKLAARGWTAAGWPVEDGGPGWTAAQRWIYETECAQAGTPYLFAMSERIVGPVISRYGTPEQKAFYLPRILSGEDYWCQGYSEPGAGSDLASLKTSAVRDGDAYLVNGSKIWTSHAHFANRMFTLVRTSSTGRKQQGITVLLIDMDRPGVTVRPIHTIGGDHEVNEVFLDNVRVPVANLVGQEGEGWEIAKYLLEFERGAAILSPRLRASVNKVAALAESEMASDSHEHAAAVARLSEIEVDIDALEMIELLMVSSLDYGQTPGAKSSLLKLRIAEIKQAINRLAVEIIGEEALVWEDQRPLYATTSEIVDDAKRALVPTLLNGRATTIFGGSAEMQREIIAREQLRA